MIADSLMLKALAAVRRWRSIVTRNSRPFVSPSIYEERSTGWLLHPDILSALKKLVVGKKRARATSWSDRRDKRRYMANARKE